MKKSVSLICLLLFLAGCSDTRPFIRKTTPDDLVQPGRPEDRPDHQNVLTFFALGDWGTGKEEQKAVAAALRKNVGQIPPGRKVAPFVLGLGDNVYEKGLPEGWNNPEALSLLDQTFGKMFSDVKYEGKNITFHIVPGNHDYNDIAGGRGGLGDVINQETTAEKLYDNWEYYPIDPAKNSDTNDLENYQALKKEDIGQLTIPQKLPIESAGKVSIIAIDTQVLLNLYENSKTEVLQKHLNELESLLQNDSKWKFIIGHHPIKSHGKHGGFRKAIWWVPPIILATIVDILFIKRLQDIDNRYYKKLIEALSTIMKKYPGSFYLAGHEHSLQFLEVGKNNLQIVSGSAAKLSGVTHKSDTIFSHSAYGFARFDITDEELWIEFFEVNVENEEMNSTALFKVSN
ncbi:metallophosphoesterase [candidate division KSB1 bacterium]|nr:metallophosphoesterase [candidate division KSB1 bacterium]